MSKPLPDKKGLCPICRKPAVAAYRPFCSKHCADVDLGRWFSAAYAIPAVENDAAESDDEDGEMLP